MSTEPTRTAAFERREPTMPNATLRIAATSIGAVLLLLLAGHLAAPGAAPVDAAPQTLLERWRDRAGVPAVVVAVQGPGRSRWVGTAGTALRDAGPPVTADARFRVASVTKLFVATVVLQLEQEHRLSTGDQLDRFLPDFPGAAAITVGELLDHTSGVPDYGQVDGFTDRLLRERGHRFSAGEVLAGIARAKREFRAGTGYAYSNSDYLLLGEVITAVTGQSWAAEVRRRILDPLGLGGTYVAGAEPASAPVIAGYFDMDRDGREENVETGQPWPALETSEGPAGAIVSTAGDLLTFGDALYHGRLVSPATLRRMTGERPFHARNSNYGLGTEITHLGYDTTVVGHGGFLPGFRSLLWYAPDRDMVIVVLANDSTANPADLGELLLRTRPAERAWT